MEMELVKKREKYLNIANYIRTTYSEERMKVIRSHIMKQNADLQEGILKA